MRGIQGFIGVAQKTQTHRVKKAHKGKQNGIPLANELNECHFLGIHGVVLQAKTAMPPMKNR